LKEAEYIISQIYEQNSLGVFSKEKKDKIKDIESNKRKIMEWEAYKYRMKSRAICLAQGHENMKLF
jgi:hypothetical protein